MALPFLQGKTFPKGYLFKVEFGLEADKRGIITKVRFVSRLSSGEQPWGNSED